MNDLMEAMADPIKASPKKKAKKKGKSKNVNHLDSGDPKHHLVHVHVNVVNSAAGQEHSKKHAGNNADDALYRLRGY